MNSNSIARGLAWFGIGLGLAEVLATRRVARAAGLDNHEKLIQLFGVREIVSGIAVLAAPAPERWLGLRVSGDLLDGVLLASGLLPSNPKRGNTLLATFAVAPVVALDLLFWLEARRVAA